MPADMPPTPEAVLQNKFFASYLPDMLLFKN